MVEEHYIVVPTHLNEWEHLDPITIVLDGDTYDGIVTYDQLSTEDKVIITLKARN